MKESKIKSTETKLLQKHMKTTRSDENSIFQNCYLYCKKETNTET